MTTYPNWFGHYAQQMFDRNLTELAGKPGLRLLQVGVFTGDATMWLCEHVLTGARSVLVDVDTWEGSDEPEHEPFDFADVERVYDSRTGVAAAGMVEKFKGSSRQFFFTAPEPFDFIYIDGDHTAAGVLEDAVHSVPLLKPGGLLAFDDYEWKSGRGSLYDPAPAIDAVADLYADQLTPVERGLQAWFRKAAC